MKSIIAIILLSVTISINAGETWGFLNQDMSYNQCFVGLDAETFEYNGVTSNRFLTQDQRDLMQECDKEKQQGLPHFIVVRTTPAKQVQSNGVTTHFPDIEVECMALSERDFGTFLATWRNAVRSSNFRRCF